jgi:hypothetical protein
MMIAGVMHLKDLLLSVGSTGYEVSLNSTQTCNTSSVQVGRTGRLFVLERTPLKVCYLNYCAIFETMILMRLRDIKTPASYLLEINITQNEVYKCITGAFIFQPRSHHHRLCFTLFSLYRHCSVRSNCLLVQFWLCRF